MDTGVDGWVREGIHEEFGSHVMVVVVVRMVEKSISFLLKLRN